MVSRTVGRVDFLARLDGRGTERDAEQIGRRVGDQAGRGMDQQFNERFRQTLTKAGREAYDRWQKSGKDHGGVYTQGLTERITAFNADLDRQLARARQNFSSLRLDPAFFNDFSKGITDVDAAAEDLNKQLQLLRENGEINDRVFASSTKQVNEWAESTGAARRESERLRVALESEERILAALDERKRQNTQASANLARVMREQAERSREVQLESERTATWFRRISLESDTLRNRIDVLASKTGDLSLKWGDLSHNTRQWTLIIGAVLAGLQSIAVLGSAAGAGVLALGGAVTSNVIGIGGLVAVITTLAQDLDSLPASLRPVAAEFKGLREEFSLARNVIASGAFAQLSGQFSVLGDSVRALNPEFLQLGQSTGRVLRDFIQNTREGSEGFEEIRRAIQLAGPNFEATAAAAGTLGLALLRAFNQAQPLVIGLIGYIQTLADRFDAFTRSDSFGIWLSNAQRTFSSLGPLIDATGRLLNDLVTPGAVVRTAAFLDSLTGFMPALTTLLDILGRFDVFGIAAALLEDLGRGLAPLAPATGALADAVRRVALIISDELGDALIGVSAAIAPVIQGFANFLNALPPDVIAGITNAILILGAAFVTLRGAAAIGGAVTALTNFSSRASTALGATTALSGKIGAWAGRAGIWGAAAAGVLVAAGALDQWYDQVQQTDRKAREAVATGQDFADTYDQLGRSVFGLLPAFEDASGAIDMLGQVGTDVGSFFGTFAATFSDTGRQASALAATLSELDAPLASLAQTNLPAATEQFTAYTEQLGASREQTLTLIQEMPAFEQALLQTAQAMGLTGTNSELVSIALGELVPGVEEAASQLANMQANTSLTEQTMAVLEGRLGTTGGWVDDLADRISNFASVTFDTRDAARDFEAAIDDLEQSIRDNGNTLDITTEQGRNNERAIDDLAQATLDLAGKTLEQTGKQQDANRVIADGRQRLIEMLGQFGITGQAAENYADNLGLIPPDVATMVRLYGIEGAEAALGQLVRTRSMIVRVNLAGQGAQYVDRAMAAGGTLYGPTRILAGEAGREMIVPLDRPLSMIDPSVRQVAAYAQGKDVPMASGGTVGGGRQVTNFWEPGAIVVQGSDDPEATADAVLRAIAENTNG